MQKNAYCYPPETHGFLIGLMEKFELCYSMDSENILIPDLLEEGEKQSALAGKELLTFIFKYQFFPRSILPRFLVRLHKDIKETLRWRTGVVLQNAAFPHTTALVKADEKDGKITVWVEGERKREFFQTIRKTLHDIHGTFDKLDVEELMPLPDRPDVMIEYEELVGHEVEGRREIFIGRIRRNYDVSQLLNGVVSEEKRMEQYKQNKHEYVRVPKGNGDTIINLQNINQQKQGMKAIQTATQQVDIDISIDIKQELPNLQDRFAEVKELIAHQNPALAASMDTLENSLDGLLPDSDKKELAAPMNKLKRFLKKLRDENSEAGKILAATKKGMETAQKLGRAYNTVGQWLGLPHIPDVLLGEK
ncbi:MAG: hypothetical protein GY765_12700 [bacterium]|nr:hypothetical protein [bacterium]